MSKQVDIRALHPMRALSRAVAFACLACLIATTGMLAGCSGSGEASARGSDNTADAAGTTGGPAFERPASLATSPFSGASLEGSAEAGIDVSSVSRGYVGAVGTNSKRLKFRVTKDDRDYTYDLPNDGTPIACPLTLGNGTYSFTIYQNTHDDSYVPLEPRDVTVDVALDSEFEPFIRPNVYCDYNESSACVQKADELSRDAENQGDVLRAIYTWISENIAYDKEKADALADAKGYVPDPDETLKSGKGICFDYASLAAAMLRSQGIPTKIITGYVSPDNIYHAWNMVYLDGTWVSERVSVKADSWERIDITLVSLDGEAQYVGDGVSYTDLLTY